MISDRDLRKAVEEALDWEPIVNAKRIGVSAKEGVVTLSGHADSFPQIREAEKSPGWSRGSSRNAGLQVAAMPPDLPDDEAIAGAASHAISSDTLLPASEIQVWVDNGRDIAGGRRGFRTPTRAADRCIALWPV